MSLDFTVAIPTYNGANRLPKVLEKLRLQVNLNRYTWEILIVDNNSTDDTAQVICSLQETRFFEVPLRYCFEARQGIAYARQTAINAADGCLVGFLDDDTLPEPTWVEEAIKFRQRYPQVGAFGGQIHPQFDHAKPKNFEHIATFFAIRERGAKPHPYRPQSLELPPGAGLVVRRQAWLQAVPQQLANTARGGNDFEALLYLHRSNWEIWYAPNLEIYHHIPQERLELKALHLLVRKASLCICQLRLIEAHPWQFPQLLLRLTLGGTKRTVRHLCIYRTKLLRDPFLLSELFFYVYSALSPSYWLWQQLRRRQV